MKPKDFISYLVIVFIIWLLYQNCVSQKKDAPIGTINNPYPTYPYYKNQQK